MNVIEMRAFVKGRCIRGYSTMKKRELEKKNEKAERTGQESRIR